MMTCQVPGDLATRWFELQLKLTKETPGFSPPVAARAFAYAGVTLYQSVVGGMPTSRSLVGQLNGLASLPQPETKKVYWAAAANSAMATILRDLYPTALPQNLAAIYALEEEYASRFRAEVEPEVYESSAAFGVVLATAVFDWSKADGGHAGYASNFPASYVPPSGPGMWVPTPPLYQLALQPYWGNNRTFALTSGQACDVPPPTPYSEDPDSLFRAEAWEVYQTGVNLTDEQRTIALFWSDAPGATATPPGHSIAIATQVLRESRANLALAAESYARVGLAVGDAFVACWNTKYTYNLMRPVTYIQAHIDPDWLPLVSTPPFPEYASGHSVQMGAVATVLTDLFGDNYAFTDRTHQELGLPARSFNSFFDAAQECAISRI